MKKTKKVYVMVILQPDEVCYVVNKKTRGVVQTIKYSDVQHNQVVKVG